MAVQSEIQKVAAAAVEAAVFSIQATAQAELAAAAERRLQEAEARAAAEVAKQRRDAALMRALMQRVRIARNGIRALLELSRIPELRELARIDPVQQRRGISDHGLPDGNFLYYGAWNDDVHVLVVLHPDLIIIDYDGDYGDGQITFSHDDTAAEIAMKLEGLASHARIKTFRVQDDSEKPGPKGDLTRIAFQVLVDAANPKRLMEYFRRSIAPVAAH